MFIAATPDLQPNISVAGRNTGGYENSIGWDFGASFD